MPSWKREVININTLFVLFTSTTPANDNTEDVEVVSLSRFEMEKIIIVAVLMSCLSGCVGGNALCGKSL